MRSYILAFTLLYLFIFSAQAKQWAVLIASSKGWANYRHQSNIFHAYQNLVRNGIHSDNIIVFAYDDIANHPDNPLPGQVFNVPTDQGGYDVYAGIKIDYRGEAVNIKNFLGVLEGDKTKASGRVLESTAEDNVFIYLNDHGLIGSVIFPDESLLYADNLMETLNLMFKKKMYNKLVIYLETCHSGSMFLNILPSNMNILAYTAAPKSKPAYSMYCFEDAVAHGKNLDTCLTGQFAQAWMTHTEHKDINRETLFDQFEHIKSNVRNSNPQRYGSLDFQNSPIAEFHGNLSPIRRSSRKRKYDSSNLQTSPVGQVQGESKKPGLTSKKRRDSGQTNVLTDSAMSPYDIKRTFLQRKAKRDPSKSNLENLKKELTSEKRIDTIFKLIKQKFALNVKVFSGKVNFKCMKARNNIYQKICGSFTEYGYKYSHYIHQTCIQNVKDEAFEFGITQICEKYPKLKN